jgi:nucleoside-diphosphate-sugar epimerase
MTWQDQTVFVTGATGFIGGRICERLVLANTAKVRALVHSPHKAARIARLPIELVRGSLLYRDSLRSALGDATIVIHCGLGNARGIVRGTENLLTVAADAGVAKFIHMSTAAVHGLTPPPGSETEETPVRPTGDNYCDNKRRAERVVARFGRRGMHTVILRPSIVYGPYSAWSTRMIHNLRQHTVALIDGGRGACNTIYVDNLIDAIFLALSNDAASQEIFFVTDGEAITWGEFIRAHVAMLGVAESLPEISSAQVLAYHKQRPGLLKGSVKATAQALRSRQFREILMQIPLTQRALSGAWDWLESLSEDRRQMVRSRLGVRRAPKNSQGTTQNVPMPDEVDFATQTGSVFFRIDKARRILGYEPRVPFRQGIAIVEQWMRHANYI